MPVLLNTGMRFRNHKIIYLSLGVNDTSTAVFDQICAHFGGFIDYNDDLDNGWQKIERQKQLSEDSLEPITDVVSMQNGAAGRGFTKRNPAKF